MYLLSPGVIISIYPPNPLSLTKKGGIFTNGILPTVGLFHQRLVVNARREIDDRDLFPSLMGVYGCILSS